MTHRERFFSIAKLQSPDRLYFAPDITDWYLGNHRGPGEPLKYAPGVFIPDEDSIRHEHQEHLDPEFQDMSLLDIYKKYDWGIHCHIRDWYDVSYTDGVSAEEQVENGRKTETIRTPNGSLSRHYQLAADGSWASLDYWVKDESELPILYEIIRATRYTLRDDNIKRVLSQIGEQGQADIVVNRSPFGKFLHEYMGFENTVYFLEDNEDAYAEYEQIQTESDMALLKLAAQSSCNVVLICDHADATLFSPSMYRAYCVPFYKAARALLEKNGKFVSTHVDGNLSTLLPLLGDAGFHILDGCTPAPMFDYEPEQLAAALDGQLTAFVGVPSSLFCDGTSIEVLCDIADRIIRAFDGKVIINVGDILPANGDIRKLAAVGAYIQQHPLNIR